MENENNNQQPKEKQSYRFSPEKAGMRDKFYPVYSTLFLGLIIKFFPLISYKLKLDFSLFGYNAYNIDQKYFNYISILFVVIALLKYIKLKVYMKTTEYTLTPQRLTIEQGFFSKYISNLELWRVTDIQIKQSFTQKSFGSCTIQMITTDISDPLIEISCLPYKKGRELYNILSEYVNDSIKNGGIMRTV